MTSAPLVIHASNVDPAWIDYNGHMNDACYAIVFSNALDALLAQAGLDAGARAATGRTIYTASLLIHYLREVKLDDRLGVSGRILEFESNRLRVWLDMVRLSDATPVALSEQLILCVDQSGATPRVGAFPEAILAGIARLHARDASQPFPARAGEGIRLRRR